MSKRARDATVQVNDGAWYALGFKYTHEDCCDCGLSHRLKYKLEKGRIFVQYTVDPKRTAKNRAAAAKAKAAKSNGS